MARPKRVLFVVNDPAFFLSHRLPLGLAARERGYDVHVATGPGAAASEVRAQGFPFHEVPLSRSGRRPDAELRAIAALYKLFRELAPDLVHLVTIKPVLYGGIAARLARVPAVVSAVSGLGYVFIQRGARATATRAAVRAMYRVALGARRGRTIFQNGEDLDDFVAHKSVRRDHTVLIRGSGVDLARFRPTPEPPEPLVVMLPSRMLWDKGVGEMVEAARSLRAKHPRVRFVLVGDTDPNPASIPRATLEGWRDEGVVEWWGFRRDMPDVLAQAHVVVLPSYREGLPKGLIEAAAAGRPIVTSDVPGCREVVRHEDNGLLVPVKDAVSLAAAIDRLLADPDLRRRMGARGRERAVEEFSVEGVVESTMSLYRDLLGA